MSETSAIDQSNNYVEFQAGEQDANTENNPADFPSVPSRTIAVKSVSASITDTVKDVVRISNPSQPHEVIFRSRIEHDRGTPLDQTSTN